MKVDGVDTVTVWIKEETVQMIDQRVLPHSFEVIDLPTYHDTGEAIRNMTVRGAGAIGATAGYAMAQAALAAPNDSELFRAAMREASEFIQATRPTAQNLFYAVNRVNREIGLVLDSGGKVDRAKAAALATAEAIASDDAECCRRIGEHGNSLITDNMRISTHCNAGWLAFVDWGSALSPIYAAHRSGKKPFVWVDETRPRLQGANLTAWELLQEGVPHSVIADNATGHYMRRGEIDMVIVGSDRIAANGDVANKIGTYSSAVVAKANGIPFYVAAPTTTIDVDCPHGDDIPIEERDGDEVAWTHGWNEQGSFSKVRTMPMGSTARNPAFDVTPAELVTGIITEKGIIQASVEGVRGVARGASE
jgi:methylthioribose-1-phosphate isomerase